MVFNIVVFVTHVIQWFVWALFFVLISTTISKFSIIALLIPVQGVKSPWRVQVLWALGILQAVFALITMGLIVFECDPVPRLWNVLGQGTCPRKETTHKFGLAQGAISAFVDFALALWPLSMVPNLKVSMKAKVGFCVLMGLGTITGLASILRDVFTQQSVDGRDVTSDTYVKLLFWAELEQTGIILLSTIPTLRPLFRKLLGRHTNNTPSSKGYRTHTTGNGNASYVPRIAHDETELDEVPFAKDKDATINVSTTFSVQTADEHLHHAV
ncbi:hypothetical protein ANO11243_086960 [Dothideomycetidae sp. 11243]|nr:hypothetical protein ANO11243_086960 [fungal sp. No.11243]